MGVLIAVKCTHCQSTEVIKHGSSSKGKQRYLCLNTQYPYQTFSLKIAYAGRQKHVKQQIIEMTLNGSGVRDIARVLHISPATVINELKKKLPQLKSVNQKLLSHRDQEQIEVIIEERQRAEGRRQKGFIPYTECPNPLRDCKEQGFKTPSKLEIWWLSFRWGLNPHLNETFCPLPSYFCLLQRTSRTRNI